ncbi:MAG: LysM peptidoglycan-binding domain-containing protein, partial [Desulfobacterales bacterium]
KLRAMWPDNVTASQSESQQSEQTEAADGSNTAAGVMDQHDAPQVADTEKESEAALAAETETTAADSRTTVSEPVSPSKTGQIALLNPGPGTSDSDDTGPVESTQAGGHTAALDRPEPEPQKEIQTVERSAPYDPMLGNLTLKRNDTLSRVIQQVYGNYNSRYFRSLILANPVIDDPDRVDVGQTIYLPAIPVSVGPSNQKAWWIQIAEKDNLQAAFDYLRNYPENEPAVRMIPYWNSQEGNRFAIILKAHFSDEDSARQQLSQLPTELISQGRILSRWEKNTVFFANPFSGRSAQLGPILKGGSETDAAPSMY